MRRTTAKGSAGTWSRQQPELGDQLLGEEALARGEDLAQLDVGGPEALEGRRRRRDRPARDSVRAPPPVADVPAGQGRAEQRRPPRTTRAPGGSRRRG